MGIWDNETLAKLRAMKNKMLGLDEKNIDSGIEKDKERGEPLSKITRTYKVEKVIKGKRYIEERTEEKFCYSYGYLFTGFLGSAGQTGNADTGNEFCKQYVRNAADRHQKS